jgi:signal transduction histidine kinase
MREAGHELRTPITICRGHVEVLSLKPGEEELEETVTLLLDEFDRMGRILEDLSSIELSEHPNFVRASEFALKPFVEEVARKVRPFLGDRLTVHSTLNGEAIRADPQRLTQALLNLLQNAAVHADPDAGVEFRVREEPGVIRFEVADSGGGVPAGKEDAVFRPFYRISHVRPGSGLGLALVRSIAEAHGGAAGVENAPGVGATFWLTVPR